MRYHHWGQSNLRGIPMPPSHSKQHLKRLGRRIPWVSCYIGPGTPSFGMAGFSKHRTKKRVREVQAIEHSDPETLKNLMEEYKDTACVHVEVPWQTNKTMEHGTFVDSFSYCLRWFDTFIRVDGSPVIWHASCFFNTCFAQATQATCLMCNCSTWDNTTWCFFPWPQQCSKVFSIGFGILVIWIKTQIRQLYANVELSYWRNANCSRLGKQTLNDRRGAGEANESSISSIFVCNVGWGPVPSSPSSCLIKCMNCAAHPAVT